ncbi:hypothetical protein AMJ80_01525 [bacterium SM23_31]|nr:MAG: hypothetical protein AMJ80_01525 [bacterium SM23_31]
MGDYQMKFKILSVTGFLCLLMFFSVSVSYAQDEKRERLFDDVFPGEEVLYKPVNGTDRGILFMDAGKLLGNCRTYGYWQSNYFPYMVHGYWGEILRMFPMVGMPPGPWGMNIPTYEYGIVDRSMNYNVLELVVQTISWGWPMSLSYPDWESRDSNLERAMGGPDGARSGGIPLIANSTRMDSWPRGYYGEQETFAGSGAWTDKPGERHWPGRWARETNPASPDYGKPVYGRFASAKDAYFSEYDKYAGIRPGDNISTSYPVGLDMETSVYCYASPLYEDIIYWDVDLIFMEEDWVRAPNGDESMGDPLRHIYTGTIDSMYFGIYFWTQFPDYRRESHRYYARPYAQDTYAWLEARNNPEAIFFYHKYGYHTRQWGTAYSGPVSVYSIYFPQTPFDIGITSFHWFEKREIDKFAPGQNWELRLYSMMSGQPWIIEDKKGNEQRMLFHPYPEAGEEPNYKIDNIDSLIHWHDYTEDGVLRINNLDCVDYGQRPYANFMIGSGPFQMSPGDTAHITFCMFGSDDNPGPLSPGSAEERQMEVGDRWPINDPLRFGVDPHDRFVDVYNNLDAAVNLYNSFLCDNTLIAPVIITYSPALDTVITEGYSVEFSVTTNDMDSETLYYTWFLDDTVITADTTTNNISTALIKFPFGSEGTYSIKMSVSDGELSMDITWNITVQEIITQPEEPVIITLPEDSLNVTVNFTDNSFLIFNFTGGDVANKTLFVCQYSYITYNFPQIPVFSNGLYYCDISSDVDNFSVEMSFGYSDSLLNVRGIDEDKLAVSFFDITDPTCHIWRSVPAVIDKENNIISVTTNHFSLWAVTSGDEELINVPGEIVLHQNYPNPFNTETTIYFELPEKSFVKLIIYNILGQEVQVLLKEEKTGGIYFMKWDGKNASGKPAPSGLYLYKIIAEDFVKVKKMLLIR